MGRVVGAVLPVAAVLSVIVAVTKPAGDRSVVLIVGVLAAAGIALLCAGFVGARARRR